jgi:hypothetical protein
VKREKTGRGGGVSFVKYHAFLKNSVILPLSIEGTPGGVGLRGCRRVSSTHRPRR